MHLLAPQTYLFIDQAIRTLDNEQALPRELYRNVYHPWWRKEYTLSAESARALILELEEAAAAKLHGDAPQLEVNIHEASERFPIVHDVVQVLPVFNQAIILECHRPLVRPSEVPSLLYLLRIPSCGEGMEIENHGFGYHFHYGKIKSDTIVRTNLLLTFDPENSNANRTGSQSRMGPPLFGEYHAEGKNKTINVEAIGNNKRLPIYTVCLLAADRRGLNNFKRPRKESFVFHGGKNIA
nr:hypothetical protein [uncultured Acinetobacter sp.]